MERTQRGKEIVGVQVSSIEQDTETPFQEVHEPGHPDADAQRDGPLPERQRGA